LAVPAKINWKPELELKFQLGCGIVPPRSYPNYAEWAPMRFSPELQRDPTCRSRCALGKDTTSRGLTPVILEAAYALTMIKSILVWAE